MFFYSPEKEVTLKLRINRHRKLSARITELSEELEELRSQKAMLLRELTCRDNSEITAMKMTLPIWQPAFPRWASRKNVPPI